MKKLLVSVVSLLVGAAPGLLLAYVSWVPLRLYLFSQIPVEVQWAFWAELVTCICIFATIGGSLPVAITLIGTAAALSFITKVVLE